jgi:hypothetical protein
LLFSSVYPHLNPLPSRGRKDLVYLILLFLSRERNDLAYLIHPFHSRERKDKLIFPPLRDERFG